VDISALIEQVRPRVTARTWHANQWQCALQAIREELRLVATLRKTVADFDSERQSMSAETADALATNADLAEQREDLSCLQHVRARLRIKGQPQQQQLQVKVNQLLLVSLAVG
jgi:hypothetical protein